MKVDFTLYLITDRKQLAGRRTLISAVRQALRGGVRAVQLREKDLDDRELLKMAYKMRTLTKEYGAKLFINDRFDVALAVGADGVHLTQNSIPAPAVRAAVKRKLIIGVSTHSLREAKEAERGGADFITFGPVYDTPSKRKFGEPAGVEKLSAVCRKIDLPVFALGGIKCRNVKEVKENGAYGISMISEIFSADHIQKKTKELFQLLNADV